MNKDADGSKGLTEGQWWGIGILGAMLLVAIALSIFRWKLFAKKVEAYSAAQ